MTRPTCYAWDCTNAATVCAHVRLKPGGIAFYYACGEHDGWTVGQRTDMSEVVAVRMVDGAGDHESANGRDVEQARARGGEQS